jgi:branched-chain amino acid transport system substrate-binding protein
MLSRNSKRKRRCDMYFLVKRFIGVYLIAVLLCALGVFTNDLADAREYIKIGAMLPLTGQVAPEGIRHKEGYDLWAKVCNEKGGIRIGDKEYGVTIKYYDYKSETGTAMKLMEKMISQDKIMYILGPFGSGLTKGTSSVSEKYGAVMVVPTGGSVKAFTPGYKYLFGTLSDNIRIIEPQVECAMVKDNPPRTSVIAARNDLYTMAVAGNFKKVAEAAGIKTLAFDKYVPGTKDFSSVLTRFKQLKPDWIFVSGYLEELITVTKNMKQLNVNAKAITMTAGPSYWDYIASLGRDADYISTPTWWHEKARWQGDDVFGPTQNYNKVFMDTYGHRPDYLTASASACGVSFQKAFEKADSVAPDKVRDAMASLNFTSFFGPIKFGPVGQNIALPGIVLQIKDKDWLIVRPNEMKDKELIYPVPDWEKRE